MKVSEKLCARMNFAVCLENFIDKEDEEMQYLTACLEDKNRDYDCEIENETKESIRIHKYAIDLAKDVLSQLDG